MARSGQIKKLLLVAVMVIAVIIAWRLYKFRGILPAVLPPTQAPIAGNSPNATGLTIPRGFTIDIFARELGNARDLEFTSGGTLLVSIPQQGKVLALPNKDQDDKADSKVEILSGLNRPHGLAFYKEQLFVAEETRVLRYNWDEQRLSASLDKVLFDLPAAARHFTRTIAFASTGQMFVSIGSTCDVCFEKDPFLAAVVISDSEGTNPRLFAKGLRNSVFITVNPQTQELWATEMGRDFLGDLKPPDEINIIRRDKDYGWPLCYGKQVHDTDFDKNIYIQIVPQPPCGTTEIPAFEICAHCAPLGLTFINSAQFPQDWKGDLLVAYHGSWNSSKPVGYKVVRLNVEGEKVTGEESFIDGFLKGLQVIGRPVDLIFADDGTLYISDDKASVIYILSQNTVDY